MRASLGPALFLSPDHGGKRGTAQVGVSCGLLVLVLVLVLVASVRWSLSLKRRLRGLWSVTCR